MSHYFVTETFSGAFCFVFSIFYIYLDETAAQVAIKDEQNKYFPTIASTSFSCALNINYENKFSRSIFREIAKAF